MKVGIFLENPMPEIGGGYTFENEIIKSLVKCSSEIHHTFVVFSYSKEQPTGISAENIQFISLHRNLSERIILKLSRVVIRVIKNLLNPLSQVKKDNKLKKSILKNRVEFLWYLTQDVATMEVPYITVVWDLQHRLQPYFPEVSAEGQWDSRERYYSSVLRRASVIIAGTEAGKAEIERFYQVPAERIKILPHPTPGFALKTPPNDEKQVLAKYNIPDNYLFYPAQFWPHKNHINLLLAVKLLRDQHNIVFPVVFVGSDKGNLQYIKKQVAELNLSIQVHFLGFVSRENLTTLYRRAFALTYITCCGPENLPPLEAFALGCPVIASNVSGAEEQLGDAAMFVDPKDPNQIALAVKSLYDDPELRSTLIQRGATRAHRYTGEDFVKAVFSILDDYEPIRRCWSNEELYHQND